MWWLRRDPEAVLLVEECEAFLAGTFAELCESRGEPVPVWAWMTLLAHRTEDQLQAVVTPLPNVGPWYHGRGFLAGEALDLVACGRVSLAELQRDVMSCAGADRWMPGQLVSGLLGALPIRRSRQRP